ncbi:polyprenyl synthetase family protein [Paraoerskovia sediminicola]|uniref:polyprenyl synthetase family protein n=1 Tax=Paraoerskovia sediminicola TaxID=1138587 RepID=UPI0025746A10|nr:polyprenyl synthetase family protein [Paraoerskovia sediminicola]
MHLEPTSATAPRAGTTTDPLVAEAVREDVDAAVTRRLDVLAADLARVDPGAAPVLAEATALLTGGKRLRAAFCYWSWRAHGGAHESEHRAAAVGAGAALELFQAAALVHDDVMDRSDTRRGRPAAHRAFENLHTGERWTGDGEQFGTSGAILLGDVLLVACGAAFREATAEIPAPDAERARTTFDFMQTEVTLGQFLDVRAQSVPWGDDADADEERARVVLRTKSARYSVEHPVRIGAALAGADDADLEASASFGLPIGEAFQLRDDLLGVFGDPQVTGKPAGDDLREGKRTLLVNRALRSASDAGRRLLLERLGAPDLEADEIDRMKEILTSTGAVADVEVMIATRVERALAALDATSLDPDGAARLTELAVAATRRRS